MPLLVSVTVKLEAAGAASLLLALVPGVAASATASLALLWLNSELRDIAGLARFGLSETSMSRMLFKSPVASVKFEAMAGASWMDILGWDMIASCKDSQKSWTLQLM
jgi:hypothetical protein